MVTFATSIQHLDFFYERLLRIFFTTWVFNVKLAILRVRGNFVVNKSHFCQVKNDRNWVHRLCEYRSSHLSWQFWIVRLLRISARPYCADSDLKPCLCKVQWCSCEIKSQVLSSLYNEHVLECISTQPLDGGENALYFDWGISTFFGHFDVFLSFPFTAKSLYLAPPNNYSEQNRWPLHPFYTIWADKVLYFG